MSPTRSAALLVLGASAIVASCGGSTASSGDDDASRSGRDATDEGADAAIKVGADSSANDSADHLSGDGGGDDGRGDADAFDAKEDRQSSCPSDPSPPATVPSTGTVTFVVTNRSAFQRYVVTRGQFCDPFTVDGQQLSAPYACICECPAPRVSFTLATLAAGASIALTWDGRHVVPYTTHVYCGDGYPGQGCLPVAGGSAQPTAAGGRTVGIAYTAQVPVGTAAGGCTPSSGGFDCASGSGSTTNTQCGTGLVGGPSIQIATQTFDLPASGDVTVQVSVP